MKQKRETKHCPDCGRVMLPETNYCGHCGAFSEGGAVLEPRQVTDQMLGDLIRKDTWKKRKLVNSVRNKISSCFLITGAVLLLPAALDDFFPSESSIPLLSMITGFLVMVAGGTIAPPKELETPDLTPEKIRALGKKYIAPGEVENLLGCRASYLPEGHLAEEAVREADCFGECFQNYEGSEWVETVYRKVPLEMGHVRLTADPAPGGRMKTVFEGHCILAKTGIQIPEEIRLTEKELDLLNAPEGEKLPSAFEEIFRLESQDFPAIDQVFTPRRKERILEICRQNSGRTQMMLKPDGRVFIACEDDEHRIFDPAMDPALWRRSYREALTVPLRLLDVFLEEK